MGRGTKVGWGPDLQEEVQDAQEPEARRHGGWECQAAGREVLPDEDGALPRRRIPALDNLPAYGPVLVVPAPQADERAPLEGVPEVEKAAEDAVEGSVEGDGEGETAVEGSPALRRPEVQPGSA